MRLSIQSMVYILRLFVNVFEYFESIVVDCAVLLLWLIGSFELNQFGNVAKFNFAQADSTDPGRAACVGIDWIHNLFNFYIHYVCKDLTPNIGLRSSADDVD